MKSLLPFLLFFPLFFSCQESMQDKLIGTWENTALDVTMKLNDQQDSLMHIPEGSWERVLNIRPIVTTYTADGNFVSDYYTPEGKSMGSEVGTWEFRNDSLVLKGENYNSAYKVIFEGEKARFTALLDWDQDGQEDDLYDGWQKKIKK